jgi:sugar/nucleoside kinase (ribokinase family)
VPGGSPAPAQQLERDAVPEPRFQILGIGNAIVDVVARVEDHGGEDFLVQHGLSKGTMTLVGADAAERLYAAMPPGQESSGGSVANTCAVAAALGARVAYLGKVADDQLGRVFRHDIVAAGVHHPTPPLQGGAPTARCLILVTRDGQRTMSTFLGASVAFEAGDVDEALVADSAVTYLEGYLFDPPAAQDAFRRAAAAARRAGRQVALSLSDPFCVARHRAAFRDLLRGGVDLLFANEAEITSLYETASFDEAAQRAAAEVPLCALTRGARGSLVLRGAERVPVAAAPARVVDTTGAGDAYAAGFLSAYTAGRELAACGRLGSLAAAAAIAQLGARPLAGLRELATPPLLA